MNYYHGTPVESQLQFGDEVLDFCLTEDVVAAATYGEFIHVYRVACKNIATEDDVMEMFPEYDVVYDALDRASVREALVAAGFDGVEFGDSYECGEMTTLRVLKASCLKLVKISNYDWDNGELAA